MRKTRNQTKYCFCKGSKEEGLFSKEDEHLFELIRYLSREGKEGAGEELAVILRDMQGKISARPGQRKQLIYHLAGCPANYLEVLQRVFDSPAPFKRHVWLWWGKDVIYSLKIRCVIFHPDGKKKKVRDFKELLIQVKKIGVTDYPPYTYLRVKEKRGLIFDIMDSYEKLSVREIRLKLDNRIKDVRRFDVPVKTRMTGEEIGMLNAFLMKLRSPGITYRYCLFDLQRKPWHKDIRQIQEEFYMQRQQEKKEKREIKRSAPEKKEMYREAKEKYDLIVDKAFYYFGYCPQLYPDCRQEVLADLYKDIYSYDLRATDRCPRIFSIVKYKLLTRFVKEHPVPFLDTMCVRAVETSDEVHENYLYKIEQFVVDDEYTFDDQPEKESVYKALRRINPRLRDLLLLSAGGFTALQIHDILYREGALKSYNIQSLRSRIFYTKEKMKTLLTRRGDLINNVSA